MHVLVSGLVQGVGFRFFAARQASELGLKGFVRNLPSGEVEVVAEGERTDLEELLDQLRKGPRSAFVRDFRVTWSPTSDTFSRFEIK